MDVISSDKLYLLPLEICQEKALAERVRGSKESKGQRSELDSPQNRDYRWGDQPPHTGHWREALSGRIGCYYTDTLEGNEGRKEGGKSEKRTN